eukprot:symbB.v1.2.030642.t1/scaffold3416.1/size57224/5
MQRTCHHTGVTCVWETTIPPRPIEFHGVMSALGRQVPVICGLWVPGRAADLTCASSINSYCAGRGREDTKAKCLSANMTASETGDLTYVNGFEQGYQAGKEAAHSKRFTWSDYLVAVVVDLVLLWVVLVAFARIERMFYAPKQEKVNWGHGAATMAFGSLEAGEPGFFQRTLNKVFARGSGSGSGFVPHNVSEAYEAAREHERQHSQDQHRRGAVLLLLLLCAHWSWCFNPGLRQIQRHRAAPKPRQYQRDAVDFFFNNAEKAAEGQGLRFQMACGTGKTFTYALIISRDLVKNPNGRHVIFVPWRDLARQTAAELQRFHIKTCIVGDGLTEPDPDANVVVCVYASAHRLRGNNYRIKIVDEAACSACLMGVLQTGWCSMIFIKIPNLSLRQSFEAHHLEMKQRSGYTGIIKHGVSSELAAHFTATFYVSKGIDFRYDLDRAIEEGHVCDFIITVPVGASTDMEAMGRFILQNRGRLTPMLVALNRVSRAKKFAEVLRKLGLSAKAVDAKMNHSTRHGIKEDLRTGELDAVCVVNIFNEAVSKYFSGKKQLAMRVTRRHETKPLANVVLPLCSLCCLEWSNVTMELYDRFGRYLGGGNGGLSMEVFDERVQELKDFVEEHAFLPRLWYPKEPRQGENALARYMVYLRKKLTSHALSDSHIWKLKEIPQMSQLMEHWESDAPDLAGSFTERCVHLKKWVAQHHRLPSRRDQSQEEKHLTEMVRQVGKKFRAGQLAEDQVEMLAEIPGMPLKMERWKRLSMKAAMTWSDGCMALADWLRSHGNRKPRQKAGERDEKVLHSWLSSARQSFVNGKLSEEQIGQLEELPTMMEEILWYEARWGPEQRWQRHAEELRSWLQTKGFPAEAGNIGEETFKQLHW